MTLRDPRGPQVDHKGKDVKGEDEGDDPLKVGGYVLVLRKCRGGEDDGQGELHEDEGQFYPEGGGEDAIFAIFYILLD